MIDTITPITTVSPPYIQLPTSKFLNKETDRQGSHTFLQILHNHSQPIINIHLQ